MTTITITNPIRQLSKRLSHLDKKLSVELKNYAPYWWEESLNTSPSASQQVLVSLARFANLDIKSVLDNSQPLRFKESACNYKHASNKEPSQLDAATALVASSAKIISQITKPKYSIFSDALTLRKQFLEAGNPCVNLELLINYCWQQGVPVLYLPELPVSKKMDAVVVDIGGSPVIAITKKCKHESAVLFLLAHEMGHIFHQHLAIGQLLIDEGISDASNIDEQENQANQYAITLLTGEKTTQFHSDGQRLKAKKLVESARLNAIEHQIDAGHIVLNWGHSESKNCSQDKQRMVIWSIANAALNLLYPNPIWEQLIKEQLLKNIDENEAQGDQLDYLYKLMKIEE
ncbi:MAG: ImmA/IrrE family metallo-endopeptidase [Methylovulum sp.]|uniref:ImmA/IrrE family metallo-endopeptidase n=1 Tax=Methylovulum sp. TaxID=1916980 RepID=UPI002610987E|nr:ImmA/IrrE family metallo-endopeptidase [Methylovulum sp.]MDD2724663.1 ImmA/IrrE family metallo-endopeptidase [Methylovulum sp.]MDD5123490.1 ImmA/IrrE family metallo-endopeptidase [Methylovulum sp.]